MGLFTEDHDLALPRAKLTTRGSGDSLPKGEAILGQAAEDITGFADFPVSHWKKIWSINKEIKRRTDVVGVFPNPAALLRLAGCVLIEVHDEWQVSDRRCLSESSMALVDAEPTNPTPAEIPKRSPPPNSSRHVGPDSPRSPTRTPAVTPRGGTSSARAH